MSYFSLDFTTHIFSLFNSERFQNFTTWAAIHETLTLWYLDNVQCKVLELVVSRVAKLLHTESQIDLTFTFQADIVILKENIDLLEIALKSLTVI